MKLRMITSGLLGFVLALVLAACAGGEATPTPTAVTAGPTATPVPAGTPIPTAIVKVVPQGTLNVSENMGSENWILRLESSLHPLLEMADPLMWWDWKVDAPTNQAILEKWSFTRNQDGSVDWTFNIRKGVKFHKGWGDVTAEDVKFAFEEMLKPGSVNSYAIYFVDFFGRDPANMVVKDPYTLLIHQPVQKAAQYRMYYVFGPTEARHLRPFPKAYYAKLGGDEKAFAKDPVYAGPFEFVSHVQGYSLSLKAIPDHYRVTPSFANLNYFKVTEESTRIAMLKTGQLDIVRISLKYAKELQSAGLTTVRGPGWGGGGFPFGGLFPGRPGCDPTVPWVGGACTTESMISEKAVKVRKALTLAVDRQAMIDKVFLGYGFPGAFAFASTTPNAAWWDPKWTALPYDVKLAKQYLAEAGYPNCFAFKVYINTDSPEALDMSVPAIAAWEQDLGCKVTQRTGEYLPFRSTLTNRDTAWTLMVPSAGGQASPKPPYQYACLHAGPKTQVIVWTELEPYTRLCLELESTLDPKRVIDLNRELAQFDYDTHTSAAPIRTDVMFAVGPKIKPGWAPLPAASVVSFLEFAQPK